MQRDPDDVKEFLAESSAYLDEVEPALAMIREGSAGSSGESSEKVASMFRAFHSIKGVAGFLSFLNVQEVTHRAEEVLDKVRSGKIPLEAGLASMVLEACDYLRGLLSAIAGTGEDKGSEADKVSLLARLGAISGNEGPAEIAPGPAGAIAGDRGSPLLFDELLEEGLAGKFSAAAVRWVESVEMVLFELLDAPTRLDALHRAAEQVRRLQWNALAFGRGNMAELAGLLETSLRRPRPGATVFDPDDLSLQCKCCGLLKEMALSTEADHLTEERLRALAADLGARSGDKIEGDASAPKPAVVRSPAAGPEKPRDPSAAPGEGGKKGEIRVSLEKLDKMVELIEELGVISSSVSHSADTEQSFSEDLQKSAGKLKQVTGELQEVAMTVRLLPLSTIFRKMIRLVGDVSGKLGKKARLEIIGEETEVDKDVVEALQDPLVHILRNSLDHGLESPGDRLSAGKPESGLIRLQAWHSGGEVCISISDDGRGISAEKILAKAVSQGLVDASAPQLPQADILAFIFHPGFSLAKEVTEFSGRGVGMDVVKKNVERLKGRIELETTPGKGSTFLIRLPMANALTESMLVRVGVQRYVIRVSSIRETFRPARESITRLPDGSELVGLRSRLYPVVRLHNLHGVPDSRKSLSEGLIVLVENRGRQIGLFVDEALGKVQGVIKTPPTMLKPSQTLAGYSIIGTKSDDVAWALDIDTLDNRLTRGRN